MNSCLYDCEVVHKRLSPRKHEFRYRLFYFDVDLDELPDLQKRLGLVGRSPWNLYSICARDHIEFGKDTIRENLKCWLKQENGVDLVDSAKVRLVTMPRVLGYVFNPICFYFIHDADNHPQYVVVEVCNTFRELKPWLITEQNANGGFHLRVPKHFYVSPFTSVKAEFDFRVSCPGDDLKIHIDDVENGNTTLVSWIHGHRRDLTIARLLWYSVRFPMLGLLVIFRIHLQALKLWLKKIPHYAKTADRELQKDLYRPHLSLTKKVKEHP